MEKLTRSSVLKRENFLRKVYAPILGKQFWQVPLEVWKKGRKALDLLLEIQARYEHDDNSWALATANEPKGKVELTWEMVTGNGKYSLD